MEFLETDHQLDHNGKHLNIDVVCGMDVIEEKTKHQSMYLGATYYFCSNACQKHFDNFPERYVGDKA